MIYQEVAKSKYSDDPELDALRAFRDNVENMRDMAHQWADHPTSPQGALQLAAFEEHMYHLHAIVRNYDSINYRETERVINHCRIITAMKGRLRQGDTNISFGHGRNVQQALDHLDRMVEEREQIVEYAERNP